FGSRTTRLLQVPGFLLRRLGSSGAAIMCELFYPDGSTRQAAIVALHDGQRMAALPCALIARALAQGQVTCHGAATAYEFRGSAALLKALVAGGCKLHGPSA